MFKNAPTFDPALYDPTDKLVLIRDTSGHILKGIDAMNRRGQRIFKKDPATKDVPWGTIQKSLSVYWNEDEQVYWIIMSAPASK